MLKHLNFNALRGERKIDRRRFLQVTALGSAGFLIGCGRRAEEPASAAAPAAAPSAEPVESDLNAFVRVGSDNTVTVIVKHLDKGQGVTTGLATIVAEELDADWSQMRTDFAPADASRYNNLLFGAVQGTGGSTSTANSWMQLRTAAAAAKAMLVGAAASAWGVPADTISVASGVLSHSESGRTASFGEFAERAAAITPPGEPVLKHPAEFRLIGTRLPRLDSARKTDGSMPFTIDIERPDARVAVVAHPPKFGATVKSFDDAGARAIDGVEAVVQTPRGVAVLAKSFWTAKRGRDALKVEWDESSAETRGSDALRAELHALGQTAGTVARNDGDAPATLGQAADVVELTFDFPFLAHATMEPMDCVVELGADRCDIWTGSQLQTVDQMTAAAIAGLEPEQVFIHTQFAGGSFGRRAVQDSDYVAEAVMIAKATGGSYPVKLLWTREDDFAAGRYRPISHHVMRASLGDDGLPAAWHHRVVTQSFLVNSPFEGMIQDGIDPTAVEGAANLPYAIPNLHVDLHIAEVGVPTLWWRSVGHTQNGYTTEVFIDALARAAGRDPVEYRLALLGDHPQHARVLKLAADNAGWGEPLGAGRARGVAVHESFSSFVAEVAEITMRDDGTFSVDRVVCAVDCGIAVNPDIVRAQMEGGIGFGLSAFLREAVTLKDGVVEQQNFDRYVPLRIDEMPKVEVYIVPSNDPPTGVGEPGVPPIAPAVANALAAATGRTITSLPLGDQLKS
jgi:isoquinoline 1-oxidoreductase beta subunit